MVQLARDTFPRSIQIQVQLSSSLEPVVGNATQLQQVLLNLFVNARDAMPHGGTLTVEANNVHLNRKQTWMRPDPVSGPHVLVRVTDTGGGIPQDVIGSIFDPFFTTKEQGKGTGLGLPTVLNIIRAHGGFIEVRSTPGRGATFDVYLLPTEGTDESADIGQAAAPPTGNGECILLVDDELAILEIARETLQSYNYQVLTAAEGVEALDTYRKEQNRISLVISDLMMPRMDGGALIAELQRINPQVKVIAVSGLGSQARLGNLQSLAVQAFLTKPYTAGTLLKTIHAALTGSPADAQNPDH
jgi:CheY-like chemotaxis protein